MDKTDIDIIINGEIEKVEYINNLHGITKNNLANYTVSPYKKKFYNPTLNQMEEHWVVFDEKQEIEKSGYLIFYSVEDEAFGIGTKTNNKNIEMAGTFIGIYGSLAETINSM